MPESPRYPIAIVRRLKPPAPARVGGRVVERREDGVRVRDVSGELFVAGPGAATVGGCALVNVNGRTVKLQFEAELTRFGNLAPEHGTAVSYE